MAKDTQKVSVTLRKRIRPQIETAIGHAVNEWLFAQLENEPLIPLTFRMPMDVEIRVHEYGLVVLVGGELHKTERVVLRSEVGVPEMQAMMGSTPSGQQ